MGPPLGSVWDPLSRPPITLFLMAVEMRSCSYRSVQQRQTMGVHGVRGSSVRVTQWGRTRGSRPSPRGALVAGGGCWGVAWCGSPALGAQVTFGFPSLPLFLSLTLPLLLRGAMEDDLKTLLVDNGVPENVLKWLADNRCLTVKAFANWCDRKEEVSTHILAHIEAVKNDRVALGATKQAWREAEAQVARGIKRSAEGLAEEGQDDPLPDQTQKRIDRQFSDFYQWDLEPRYKGCDSLLGRVRREMERGAPTLFSATRVRSLADTSRQHESKKHRVSDYLQLEIDGEAPLDSEFTDKDRLRFVLGRYDILANTWATAGCMDVTGTTSKQCHWQEACRYVQHLRDRVAHLPDKFTESSVVAYLLRVEELLRGHAIEKVRARVGSMRWGEALVHVIKEHTYLWQDHKEMLRRGGGGGGPEPRATRLASPPKSMKPSPTVRLTPRDAEVTNKNCATCKQTKDGADFCKAYNDKRGCAKGRCPQGKVHACDVRLAKSGQACGSRSHNRESHDAQQHGQMAPRT